MVDIISIPFSNEELQGWRVSLSQWFGEVGKVYPWRKTSDPYEILVSELMLQQTQVKTVLDREYFENWLEKFPDLISLAGAEEEEVLKAWEGLGYYNRARNLQKTAKLIVKQHNGQFPTDYQDILALPGVGQYTAGAVSSFAFNENQAVVDGNVIRVLSRCFDYAAPIDTTASKKQIWNWAEQLTDPENPRIYNSAIMELGQTICRKSHPNCENCPVAQFCASSDDPESASNLPVKSKSTKITEKKESVFFLCKNQKIFLCQEQGTKRKGLWRLPPLDPSTRKAAQPTVKFTYPITRYRVELSVFTTDEVDVKPVLPEITKNSSGAWFNLDEPLPPLGAPYLKAIELCRKP